MGTLRFCFLLFVIRVLFCFHFCKSQGILQRTDVARERRLALILSDEPRGKDPNCLLPLDRGNCNNMTVMYYYDQTISDCRPFRWYGCTGNANRFTTGQECRSRCWGRYNVIPTRRLVNPTERLQVTTKRPYLTERPRVTTYPSTTKHITMMVTDEARGKDPICLLPLDRGSCNNMTVMYYYDLTISDCRPFRWYGCTGNATRFTTGQECRSRCWDRYNVIPTRRPVNPTERLQVTTKRPYLTERPQVTTYPPLRTLKTNVDLCDEKSERGSCSDYSVKWFYSQTDRACRRFWYGGCGGNANRFDNEKECKDVCINRRRPSPDEDQHGITQGKRPSVDYDDICGRIQCMRGNNFMNTGAILRRPPNNRNRNDGENSHFHDEFQFKEGKRAQRSVANEDNSPFHDDFKFKEGKRIQRSANDEDNSPFHDDFKFKEGKRIQRSANGQNPPPPPPQFEHSFVGKR